MNGRTNTTSVTEVIEGVQVPLEAPTNLVLTPLNARVDITWTDPVDKFAAPDGQTATNPWDNVATWSHTIIVRKANSAPTSPSDGELIYTETTRNQHQYTAYSDTNNVINNTVYYYAVYAITTMDAVSEPIVDSCKPIEGMPTYREDLTNLTSVRTGYASGNRGVIGTSIGGQALFAGGHYFDSPDYIPYNSIVRYDESFTRYENLRHTQADDPGAAANSNYAIFAGGYDRTTGRPSDRYPDTITPIDTNLTRVSTSSTLSIGSSISVGVGFDDYIIFAGGLGNDGEVNAVNSFDESITRQILTNLPQAASAHAGTSNSNYVIFGGGSTNTSSASSATIAYNHSLTSTRPSSLSVNSCQLSATTINNHSVFFNGTTSAYFTSPSTNVIDIYDSSLTKTSGPTIPQPTLPDPDVSNQYYPKYAFVFGSFIMLVLYHDLDGYGYSHIYLYDSSITLVDELEIPTYDCQYCGYGKVSDKYVLMNTYISGNKMHIYEAV